MNRPNRNDYKSDEEFYAACRECTEPFERTRRITGYLAPLHRFNDSKKAELDDRVKHG